MIDWYYLKNVKDCAPNRYRNLELMAQGYTYQEIAEIRCVEPGTVKNQVRALKQIVGAKTSTHLISLAYQAGIL